MALLRLSIGSAIALGLMEGRLPHPPTTVYVMVGERCSSVCQFCTQGRAADRASDRLSRVTWPPVDEEALMEAMANAQEKGFGRICIQVLVDPIAFSELPRIIGRLKDASGLSISLSITPIPPMLMIKMRDAGTDRIGIALDGASEAVFDRIKGRSAGNPYSFSKHRASLEEALTVFGRGNVSTHIIVGLGETDEDIFDTMHWCRKQGILLSLFAYTHVKGMTKLGEPPDLGRYRTIQVLRHLVFDRNADEDCAEFAPSGKAVHIDWTLVGDTGRVFQTRGCPDCNRPYYTERPKGPIYNYPYDYDDEIGDRSLTEAKEYVGN